MGLWVESRKGLGWRLRFSKPTLVKYAQKRPTAVYEFVYESPEGHIRTITGGVGHGRFKRGKEEDAKELFERRLSEQFGEEAFRLEEERRKTIDGWCDQTCDKIRERPELHQDNYTLKSVRKV